MANMFNKIKNYMLGAEEEYYDEDYYDEENDNDYQEETAPEPVINYNRSGRNSNSLQAENSKNLYVHTNPKSEVILTSPKSIDDAGSICDYIKVNKSVILNLENVNYETAQRIIDFLGGVIYALDGDIRSITNKVFFLAPKNVEISSLLEEELKSDGFLYSFAQSFGSNFK